MNSISIHDIQRDPNTFLDRVQAGESFVVVRGGQPLAEVRPLPASPVQERQFGLCAGQFTVPADFDQPLPEEVLKEFEGA